MCDNVRILNPHNPTQIKVHTVYSCTIAWCAKCTEHVTMWWEWLSAWSGHSRLYPTPNMISPLVWHSHLQLVLGLTVQLALQRMVGFCCRPGPPLALTLGPTVNTSGEGWPGYKALEWIRTTFVCKTIDEKSACIVIHYGNCYRRCNMSKPEVTAPVTPQFYMLAYPFFTAAGTRRGLQFAG